MACDFASDQLKPRSTTCSPKPQHTSSRASLLAQMLDETSDKEAIAEQMREAEHDADETTHTIFRQLNSSFITPFDREDIYRLASSLDDVMDFMEEAVDLVGLYEIEDVAAGVRAAGRGSAARHPADRRRHARTAHDEGPRGVLDRDQPPGEPGRPLLPPHPRRPVQRQSLDARRAQAQGHRRFAGAGHRRLRVSREHGGDDRRQGVLSRGRTLAIVIATVAVALFFDFTNGFHDAANAIATSVSTRALTPRIALAMAAIMNLVGALLGSASPRRSRASSTSNRSGR